MGFLSKGVYGQCSIMSTYEKYALSKQQDAKKRGLRPRKKLLFFTKVTKYFSANFHLISTLAEALKFPHESLKPGCLS